MYALIEAVDDGEETKILCFVSKAGAERFKDFVATYMLESGAGNGYGAYWVYFDRVITQCDIIPRFASTDLRIDLLRDMLRDILVARTANEKPDIEVDLTIGKEDNAITFCVGELPPRQRPQAGDMFRIIKRPRTPKEEYVREGRVIKDLGDTLEVISCWGEDDYGKKHPDATVVTIRADRVMKINDWKTKHRKQKPSPD